MFDEYLREIKDRLAGPLAQKMANVSPNSISLVGFILGLGSAFLAFWGSYGGALVLWLLNRGADGLDGLVARVHGKQDDFGGYLDILSDFVIYAALPIAIVLGAPLSDRTLALIVMLAVFYLNASSWMYLAAILEKRAAGERAKKTTIVMPAGLIGGFETIVFYSLFILFPSQVTFLFLTFSVLVVFTILQRLIWAKRQLSPAITKGNYHEGQHISPRVYSEE